MEVRLPFLRDVFTPAFSILSPKWSRSLYRVFGAGSLPPTSLGDVGLISDRLLVRQETTLYNVRYYVSASFVVVPMG